jgi:peptide/nickel transport system substrate-binding protein
MKDKVVAETVLITLLICSLASTVNIVSAQIYVQGVDVSSNDGEIHWGTVRQKTDIKFAFVRATQGGTAGTPFHDLQFKRNMKNGWNNGKNGMLMGPYHFATPYTNNQDDAEDEAEFFYNDVKDYLGYGLPPALDLENDTKYPGLPQNHLTKQQISDWAHKWINKFHELSGVTPIIYVNVDWATNCIDLSLTGYGLWIADWTYPPPFTRTGVWGIGNWIFQQYSNETSVQGINDGKFTTDWDLVDSVVFEFLKILYKSTTFQSGTYGQPTRVDPARAYDAGSNELIQNVYEPLISFSDKPVLPSHTTEITPQFIADLSKFEPTLATSVPTKGSGISADGKNWTFTINTNALFQPWTAANGSLIPARNVTVDDVVYSFQRQMVYDSYYAPTSMWFEPAFGIMGWSAEYVGGPFSTYSNGTFKHVTDEATAGAMMQGWVYPGPGINDVTFHFQNAWAEGVLKQIFSQTWGAILSKAWVIEHGGWDGLFTTGASDLDMSAGWSNNYHWKPTATRSEIDVYKDPAIYGALGSKYPSETPDVPSMLGTGPYRFTYWDKTDQVWRIYKFANYWKGWAGNHVDTLIKKGVAVWPTRKMLFLEGELDAVDVPRAYMWDLLNSSDLSGHTPISGITMYYNAPTLSNDAMFFTMSVSGASAYQSYVGYPTHVISIGADATFFNDVHIRRAFAWALNYTQYIQQAYFGEAFQQASWWVDGLTPNGGKNTSIPLRNLNYNMMRSELAQAALISGHNVSTEGFETTMIYNTGNDQRMIASQMIAQAFLSLGAQYKVSVVGLDWSVFSDLMNSKGLPVYATGWLADFADAENFARAYQHSAGAFPVAQGPPFPADQAVVDAEINASIIEPNQAARALMYQDLEYRYWQDVTSFPLVQPLARFWFRDWVGGWYFNPLYPGIYAYDLYTSAPTSYEPVDLDVTATITPITTYATVYVSFGKMLQYKGGGATASMTFRVSVKRLDNNTNVPLLATVIGLERYNLTDLASAIPVTVPPSPQYPTSVLVLIGPLGTQSVTLTWYEDGYTITLPANATWRIATEIGIINANAYDTNITNNVQDSTYSCQAYTTATGSIYYVITGDIDGDGVVKILDAIDLSSSFGKSFGQPGYVKAADIDSNGTVNVLDAIDLAVNFGKKVGP